MGARSARPAAFALMMTAVWFSGVAAQIAPLPSWNDGRAKQSIIAFAADVTREGSRGFIPPAERIVSWGIVTKFECRDGRPILFRLPPMNFMDDGPSKPVGVDPHIGRRPVAAFGNSDCDLEILQWTTET